MALNEEYNLGVTSVSTGAITYKSSDTKVATVDAAGNVTSYTLSAQMGRAPQKICVPLGFKWCLEYKPLYEAYPGFKDWTTGAADTWCGNYNPSLVY